VCFITSVSKSEGGPTPSDFQLWPRPTGERQNGEVVEEFLTATNGNPLQTFYRVGGPYGERLGACSLGSDARTSAGTNHLG
jgi:hypothetical protein